MELTRTNKATGEVTTLTFEDAVDQFITDGYHYAAKVTTDDLGELDDWLHDMCTVFEARSMLEDLETDDDEEGADAGEFIYNKK